VVARPDEFWGETPCVFVRLKEEGLGSGSVPSCQRTSTGKIQKYVLRNLAKEMGPTRKGASGSSSRL